MTGTITIDDIEEGPLNFARAYGRVLDEESAKVGTISLVASELGGKWTFDGLPIEAGTVLLINITPQ